MVRALVIVDCPSSVFVMEYLEEMVMRVELLPETRFHSMDGIGLPVKEHINVAVVDSTTDRSVGAVCTTG